MLKAIERDLRYLSRKNHISTIFLLLLLLNMSFFVTSTQPTVHAHKTITERFSFENEYSPRRSAFALGKLGEFAYEISSSYRISGVPYVRQEPLWCGPASLTMVLNYWGDPIDQDEVGSEVNPEHGGTTPRHMIRFLESRKYIVYDFDSHSCEHRISAIDELKIWVCHDYPVIVRQWYDLLKEFGHYRVVVGYDEEKVYVIDPYHGSITFSITLFLQLWEKNNEYALVVIGDPKKDSDDDGITDSIEILTHRTDPFDSDSDRLIEGRIAGTVGDFWIDNIVHMPTRFFIPIFIIIAISGVIVVLDVLARRKKRALEI